MDDNLDLVCKQRHRSVREGKPLIATAVLADSLFVAPLFLWCELVTRRQR